MTRPKHLHRYLGACASGYRADLAALSAHKSGQLAIHREHLYRRRAHARAKISPHPGWQPLWYCGTRFDYIYPPALRYGTALISKWGGVPTARAYHLFTATFYVFGIVTVYWLVQLARDREPAALLASAATALALSLFSVVQQPAKRQRLLGATAPARPDGLWRGPHISALAVLPAALAASWLAAQKTEAGRARPRRRTMRSHRGDQFMGRPR